MKRILAITICLCLVLTGCGCVECNITVSEDGTLTATTFVGMTTEAVNEAIKNGEELPFKADTTIIRDGVSYLGELDTETHGSLEEFNSETLYIRKDGESFAILFDGKQYAEEAGDSLGFADISEELEVTDQLYMQMNLSFPYTVTQTSGPSAGVSVDEGTIHISLLELEPAIYTFYAGSIGRFTDVSSAAWYFNAVSAMQASGLVNGYETGRFGPTDNITLSAICTIIARVDGADISNNPTGYWAESAIRYCIDQHYITSHGEITRANYDVISTREETISAISRAFAGFNAEGPFKADWQDNAKVIKHTEVAEDALRQLYNKTGYSAYLITNPTADLDVQYKYDQVFGKSNNGVIVLLNYTSGKAVCPSIEYYAEQPGKAYISSLFTDSSDPIESLLNNLDHVEVKATDWQSVTIPDLAAISSEYVNDIKVAYAVGLCSGVDGIGTFHPKEYITRAEVCQLFYNIHWVTPSVG